jgi:hypothetical protein
VLPLDSPRWAELEGSSPHLVDLLQRLPELDVDEQSELFWSHLLLQGDVYHATFAAVPHVWAARDLVDDDSTFLFFCASVVNTGFDPKYLPADIAQHYLAWLAEAQREALAVLRGPCADLDEVLRLLGIVAAGTPLGNALTDLTCAGTNLYCTCDKFFSIDLDHGVLTISGGAPPVPAPIDSLGDLERRLLDLAVTAGRADVAGYILGLAGTGTCPHCGKTSPVLDPSDEDSL